MKRFMSIALILILTVVNFVSVSASEVKLTYLASADWNENQGTDGWYSMYSTTKTIGAYENMKWGYWENIWKTCYAYSVQTGKASVYIATDGLMKPNLGSSVARVWVAPMDGTVRLTSNGGVKKNESQAIGCTVKARIVKTDSEDKNQSVLWEQSIIGTDNVGVNYDLTVAVKNGEKLYFELACADTDAYGESRWDPKVEYTRAACVSANGEMVNSAKDINDADTLECMFYDAEAIDKSSVVYLALYDENGTMVDYRNMSVDIGSWDTRKAELSLPVLFGRDSYEGWTAKIFVLVLDENRCYSMISGEPFGLY
ncbi:MAG: hypothetical protein E7415_05610 [Ruminococcaceae bacterium]|nr:hypothetical protein [Oscillospiraceae bacterium]